MSTLFIMIMGVLVGLAIAFAIWMWFNILEPEMQRPYPISWSTKSFSIPAQDGYPAFQVSIFGLNVAIMPLGEINYTTLPEHVREAVMKERRMVVE